MNTLANGVSFMTGFPFPASLYAENASVGTWAPKECKPGHDDQARVVAARVICGKTRGFLGGMVVAGWRGMTKLTSAILASLSAFALPAFVHLPQAQACSGPQSGKILSRRVLPVDGAT